MIKMQAFFGNSDQHICGYGYPYLSFHRVLAGAKEHLDAQVLLDPLEEQLHLPALTVQTGDLLGLQGKVVGQKHQALSSIVLDHHPAQGARVVFARRKPAQHPGLVAHHLRRGSVHWVRVAPLELGIALGPRHKECLGLVDDIQPSEVQIAPIQQVKRARLEVELVQRIDLVRFAVCDVNETGDIAPQVQQRMQLDGRFGGAKRCPGKHRQAQIDGGGVERIHRPVQLEREGIAGVQRACHAHQVLRKVGVDLPRARGVCPHTCICQCVARDSRTSKPHVVQPLGLGAQVHFDVAQGFPIRQLGKSHGKELVQTGEVFDLVLAFVVGYTPAKGAQWQKEHELCEYKFALVHRGLRRKSAKNPKSELLRSNRDQNQALNSSSKSLTYEVST